MKRKLFLCALFVSSLILLSACASNQNNNTNPTDSAEDNRLRVMATIFPIYDFVHQIAGESVQLSQLVPAGAETHYFEPTPQDIIAISECDVFIYVGGESDVWLESILQSIDTSDITLVRLMDLVQLAEEELVEGMQAETDEEHNHDADEDEETEYDEHVWTSPKNAMQIVGHLAALLAELDVENGQAFLDNAAAYLAELDALDNAFRTVVAEGERTVIVFGDRFPFLYFAREYGLDYYAAFPGCAAETDASAATIAFLINKVQSEQLPVVFKNELVKGIEADLIADSSGAKVLTFYACHNLSLADMQAGETYLSLMWKNVESLREALN